MVIKDLAQEFEGEFECLGENTEKHITFSVPIKKETTKKDKNGMLNIQNFCGWEIFHTMIYHFCQRKQKLVKSKCMHAICMIKKLCCSYKIIKTNIKSWANIKEGS